MKTLSFFIAGGALLLAVGSAAIALLVACGLGAFSTVPWLNFCTSQAAIETQRAREAVLQSNDDLIREIAALEAELAVKQCVAVYTPPPVPDLITPGELAPRVADDIDEEAWNNRDLAVLEGCWELDSEYRTTNRQTGEVTDYNVWNMCFSRDGAGSEEMLATNGVTCQGPVTGSFRGTGQLVIEEPGNLNCSNNTYIYRRVLTCTLDGTGGASCTSRQPEIGNSNPVALRRAVGGP